MGIFGKLFGRKPDVDIDQSYFSKPLEVVGAYGEILEQAESPIRPMHELPYSRMATRRALAMCAAGRKIPRDAARAGYTSIEGFWPSPFAYPFRELHTRLTERGAKALEPAEMATYAETVQFVNEGALRRSKEFDLMVKWYEGLLVHLLKEDRRLDAHEARELKSSLEDSVAKDVEWLSETTAGFREGGGNIGVPEGATAEQVVKEINLVNHDVKLVRDFVDGFPS